MQIKVSCPHCINRGHLVEVYSSGWLHRCLRCDRDVPRQFKRTPIKLAKTGKLLICCVHNRTIMEGVDAQLLAVGKPKGETYFRWWKHEPGLAPTRDLITFTKEHNRSKGKLDGWFERYTESLLDEWESRQDFKIAFKNLIGLLRDGKTVAVACYCHPLKRGICHLSILKDLVEDFGFPVEEAPLIDPES